MLRLLFVRHGRTPWNVQGRVQGGGGLDEIGRAQAVRLGEALAAEPLAAVYASPALRARQTARAVAHLHGLPVRQRRLLADLDYGRYAGALLADVQRERPDLFETWRAAPHTVHFDGGERLADLRERVRRFIAQAHANHDGATVLAATHDSPVRVAASLALGLGDEKHTDPDLRTPLASITELEVEGPHLRLVRHKDAAHLAGIDDGFGR
jgi:probable phosphoglycerate mutase